MSKVTEALIDKLIEFLEIKQIKNYFVNYDDRHTIYTSIDITARASKYSADCWDDRYMYERVFYSKNGVKYIFHITFIVAEMEKFNDFERMFADIIENTDPEYNNKKEVENEEQDKECSTK